MTADEIGTVRTERSSRRAPARRLASHESLLQLDSSAPASAGAARTARRARLRTSVRRRRRGALVLTTRVVVIAAVLGVWEVVSGEPGAPFVVIDEFYVSRPSEIVEAIGLMHQRGVLVPGIVSTYKETVYGFILGAFGGMAVGFAIGMSRFASDVLTPVISALYSIPRLALIPLFIVWFGLGTGTIIALTSAIVFFLTFYNTFSGVRDVDVELISVLRIMQASRLQILRRVTIPSALTWIIAGFRTSVPYALVAAVSGEMLASNQGMGYEIIRASGQFYTAGVFAGIVVLMGMALVLAAVVDQIEKRALRWKRVRPTFDP